MKPLESIDEGKVKPTFCFIHELHLFIISKNKATLMSLELYCQKECIWV